MSDIKLNTDIPMTFIIEPPHLVGEIQHEAYYDPHTGDLTHATTQKLTAAVEVLGSRVVATIDGESYEARVIFAMHGFVVNDDVTSVRWEVRDEYGMIINYDLPEKDVPPLVSQALYDIVNLGDV